MKTVTEYQYTIRTERGHGPALAVASTISAAKRELWRARLDRRGEPLRIVKEGRWASDERYGEEAAK